MGSHVLPIRIRPARPTDGPFAAPLIQEAIGAIGWYLTGTDNDQAAAQAIAQSFGRVGHRLSYQQVWVAELGDEPVGLAVAYDGAQAHALDDFWRAYRLGLGQSAEVVSEAQAGEFYLDTLVTSAQARGRGVGAALIAACHQQAQARGLPLTLLVEQGNSARRLYERCGFLETEKCVLAGHEYARMRLEAPAQQALV